MAAADCQVCGDLSFKYRCANCKVRSCSLSCFKAHQVQCQVDKVPSDQPSQDAVPWTHDENRNPRSDTTSPQTLRTQDVEALFQRYPALRSKLAAIYQAATPAPAQHNRRSSDRRDRNRGRFAEDDAFSRCLRVLRQRIVGEDGDEDLVAFKQYIGSLSTSS